MVDRLIPSDPVSASSCISPGGGGNGRLEIKPDEVQSRCVP